MFNSLRIFATEKTKPAGEEHSQDMATLDYDNNGNVKTDNDNDGMCSVSEVEAEAGFELDSDMESTTRSTSPQKDRNQQRIDDAEETKSRHPRREANSLSRTATDASTSTQTMSNAAMVRSDSETNSKSRRTQPGSNPVAKRPEQAMDEALAARLESETVRKSRKVQPTSATVTRSRQEHPIDETHSRSNANKVPELKGSQSRPTSVASRRLEHGADEASTHNISGSTSLNSDPKPLPKAKRSQSRLESIASKAPEHALEETVLNSVLHNAVATAHDLAESHAECAQLRAQNNKLQDDLKAVVTAETPAASHEAEVQRLRAQNAKLKSDLKEAHSFVFSLQPRQTSLTESEAAPAFRSLCDGVQNWVERELADFIGEQAAYKITSIPQTKRFIDHVVPAGRQASRIPDTDEYNIIAAIMSHLCVNVFDQDFYCGGEAEMRLLGSLQASMRNLEPRRDLTALRGWRSEAYTALANRPEFKEQRRIFRVTVTRDLSSMLAIFRPRGDKSSLAFTLSIEKFITEPALSLAHQFQLSVNKFSVTWPMPRSRSHHLRNYDDVECVNLLKNGKIIKPQHATDIGDITYMFNLTPALFLEVAKADSFAEPTCVNKGKVLVAAMKNQEGLFVAPDVPKMESPTLVYWMLDQVGVRR